MNDRSTPAVYTFETEQGIPFLVRLVMQGHPYGSDMALTHKEHAPLVEFYDRRYDFSYEFVGSAEMARQAGAPALGQFVSRYNLSTILYGSGGLCLNGGIPAWNIDPLSMLAVRAWLHYTMPHESTAGAGLDTERILSWNTGRPYSEHGHRLAAAAAGSGVALLDLDRNLQYFIPGCRFDKAEIMRCYDNNAGTTAYPEPVLEFGIHRLNKLLKAHATYATDPGFP